MLSSLRQETPDLSQLTIKTSIRHSHSREVKRVSSQKPEVQERPEEPIRGIIGKIRGEGQDRFAITYVDGESPLPRGTNVTFSFPDWEGVITPIKGQVVLLYEVQLFAKGWRARRACPITPTSQKPKEGDPVWHT